MESTLGPEPKFSAAISLGEEKELRPILSKILFQIILTVQAEVSLVPERVSVTSKEIPLRGGAVS